jgi:two-component system response regulator MprA
MHQRPTAQGDILVVDDDPAIVEMLCEFLEFEGYAVRGAHDGMEALDVIRACPPALVLLDVQMPYMNGSELLDALTRTIFADLPIIIITASPIEAQRIANTHNVVSMTKPLDLDVLLTGVAEVLRDSA